MRVNKHGMQLAQTEGASVRQKKAFGQYEKRIRPENEVPPRQVDVMFSPKWEPKKSDFVANHRAGADDHLKYKSKGLRT